MMRRNVVLSGGASHVATLAGALYQAAALFDVATVGGTSAGALASIGYAFGRTADEVFAVLLDLLQNDRVLDRSVFAMTARGGGLCHWDRVREAIRKLVGKGARMRDAKVPLFVVVTDGYTRRPVVISSWDPATRDVLVEDAGTTTAAIWPLAKMQTIPDLGRGNRLYFDGGFTMNYPVKVCETHADPTVGLRIDPDLDGDGEPDVEPIRDVVAAAKAVAESALYGSNEPNMTRADFVDVRVHGIGSGFDFSLTPEEIRARWACGRDTVKKRFMHVNKVTP